MEKIFKSWMESHYLMGQVENPNIEVGEYTYYSGYYHEKEFEDYCVRYLLGDGSTKNYREIFGQDFLFDRLKIGRYCSIGSGVRIIMAGNQGHNHRWISTYPFYGKFSNSKNAFERSGDTIIGNDVWIGTEAMIMPGVRVGNGVVIGARSLVTKDIPPYAIVGGNPAKIIKMRFSQEEIRMLEEISWWDYEKETLEELMEYICSSDIRGLYSACIERK